jgi:hypothetical protein
MAEDSRYKTEYCRYYPACPYGDNCLYAHSRAELRRNKNFRLRPCWSWVSTGTCPYGNKCVFIHDPRIEYKGEPVPHSKPRVSYSPIKHEADIFKWPFQYYKQEQEPISPKIKYELKKSSVLMIDVTRVIYKSLVNGVECIEEAEVSGSKII